MERVELLVEKSERGMRLEDFLCGRFSRLSKMYLRETVRDERCEVNGRFENIGYRLRPNDFIEIEIDRTQEASMVPQDIPLDIVYEDSDLIVVNKPAGMLVHPSHREKTGTLLNALTFHLNRELFRVGSCDFVVSEENITTKSHKPTRNDANNRDAFIRPGLIHRLDRDTSGLIVVAKNARAHRILAGHFGKSSGRNASVNERAQCGSPRVSKGVTSKLNITPSHAVGPLQKNRPARSLTVAFPPGSEKLVEKRYLALVDGVVADDEGVITGEIGRFAEEKRWGLKTDGKRAETRFWVRERYADSTLLELEPVTGRTNQLRIHCASIGHPIVGDVSRGGREFERLCLHAWKLSFRHPTGGRSMGFECNAIDFASLLS